MNTDLKVTISTCTSDIDLIQTILAQVNNILVAEPNVHVSIEMTPAIRKPILADERPCPPLANPSSTFVTHAIEVRTAVEKAQRMVDDLPALQALQNMVVDETTEWVIQSDLQEVLRFHGKNQRIGAIKYLRTAYSYDLGLAKRICDLILEFVKTCK